MESNTQKDIERRIPQYPITGDCLSQSLAWNQSNSSGPYNQLREDAIHEYQYLQKQVEITEDDLNCQQKLELIRQNIRGLSDSETKKVIRSLFNQYHKYIPDLLINPTECIKKMVDKNKIQKTLQVGHEKAKLIFSYADAEQMVNTEINRHTQKYQEELTKIKNQQQLLQKQNESLKQENNKLTNKAQSYLQYNQSLKDQLSKKQLDFIKNENERQAQKSLLLFFQRQSESKQLQIHKLKKKILSNKS